MTQRDKPLKELPMPDYLMSEKAHEIWVETGNILIQNGLLTDSDLRAFRKYCIDQARELMKINR